jgi:hypothetical protein
MSSLDKCPPRMSSGSGVSGSISDVSEHLASGQRASRLILPHTDLSELPAASAVEDSSSTHPQPPRALSRAPLERVGVDVVSVTAGL